MKRLLQVTAIASAVLFSVAVYADQASTPPKQTINVGADQHLVRIALPANATTGYQWYVSSYDNNLLTLNSYHYRAPTTHRVGAGGTAEFVFAVKPQFHVAPQITDIDFVYGQSWDMNGATSRVISLTSIPAYSSDSAPASSSEHHATTSTQSAKKPMATSPSSMSNTAPAMPGPETAQPAAPATNSSSSSAGANWLTIPGQS